MSIFQIINDKTRTLPFYIYSIGNDSFQNPCIRNNGFNYHHMITIIDGCGIIECDGIKEKVFRGDILFISKDVPHSYYPVDDKFSTKWVTFDGTAVQAVLDAYNVHNFKLYKDINLDKIDNSFEILYSKVDSNLSEFEISAHLYSYITTFFNCQKLSKTTKALNKAVEYIKENFSKIIILDDLAFLCNMNKFAFCREFKKTYNTTPFEFLLQTRIQYAKKLLTDSDFKVQDISNKAGFNDTGYFCRTFKKYEGFTPSEFRDSIKKDG